MAEPAIQIEASPAVDVNDHLRLVPFFVTRMANWTEDMIQCGYIELIHAARRFDGRVLFPSYARKCVIGGALRCRRQETRSRIRQVEIGRRSVTVRRWNFSELGDVFTSYVHPVFAFNPDTPDADSKAKAAWVIAEAMKRLLPRFRVVVKLRFGFNRPHGEGLRFAEIGAVLGITKAGAHKIFDDAMRSLSDIIMTDHPEIGDEIIRP